MTKKGKKNNIHSLSVDLDSWWIYRIDRIDFDRRKKKEKGRRWERKEVFIGLLIIYKTEKRQEF